MQDFEQLDYYALLGVDPSASDEAIKRAYRQQIGRYHPDRYVNASAAEQQYAQLRAQRINEAYSVLSNPHSRLAYKRAQRAAPIAPPPAPPAPASHPAPPAAPRDHQAELYQQASEHLSAGRALQAIAVLRQLQQLNPFYRDVAAQLARAEAQIQGAAQPAPAPAQARAPASNRRWIIAGAAGAVAAVGLIAASLAWRSPQPTPTASAPTAVAGLEPTPARPTLPPTSAPTLAPTAEPTPSRPPTSQPTAAPPTAQPTLLPSPVLEEGALRVEETFENGVGWARAQQAGWSVGYVDSFAAAGTAYQITADPGVGNIWSYRTAPGEGSDYSVGADVDVQGAGGSAGLLLRFQDRANYLVCLINPTTDTFRVEQRRFGGVRVAAEGSAGIQPNTTTRLVARIEGEALTLVINGEIAAEITVADLPVTPLYGLVAAAGEEQVVAQFDNLELRDIEPGT